MKHVLTFVILLPFAGSTLNAQIVATVKADNSVEVSPGEKNKIVVTVTNKENLPIRDATSKFFVTMDYKGSAGEGSLLEKSVSIGDAIEPGKSRNYDIYYTGPQIAGEYDVDICLKWGSKIVSNVVHSTFIVEGVYDAEITCKDVSLDVTRGRTTTLPLNFVIANVGSTFWPDARYNLHFDVISTPSGAGTYDKEAFKISPKLLESWELRPGEKETYDYKDFKPPFTSGNYVVRVSLYKDGKPFNAKGASETLTFKVTVR